VTRTYGRGRSAFLIEGVPVISCPDCGESYLAAETLKKIERMRLYWRQLTTDRKVPVARFRGAA
jgi:YgiT-type zinc finger domain-containing protein